MKVAIIQYNAGNVLSVQLALARLGVDTQLTNDVQKIKSADKVIFPGVGEASSAMRYLESKRLDEVLPRLNQPVLGICLGLQLMCSHSEENDTRGLGIFPHAVRRFKPTLKVPHIGWNTMTSVNSKLFAGLGKEPYLYFLHGYFADLGENTTATTEYIQPFSAALEKSNFYAVQFHPEKSGDIGSRILKNFIEL